MGSLSESLSAKKDEEAFSQEGESIDAGIPPGPGSLIVCLSFFSLPFFGDGVESLLGVDELDLGDIVVGVVVTDLWGDGFLFAEPALEARLGVGMIVILGRLQQVRRGFMITGVGSDGFLGGSGVVR